MGKSAPKAPDYTAAAEATGESNKEVTEQQTWANRPDQITPFGSQTWGNTPTYDPVTGQTLNKWTQTTTLDPNAQHALDSQLALQSGRNDLAGSLFPRAQQEFGSAMDWGGFQEAGQAPGVQGQENLQRGISTEGLQGIDSSQKYYQQGGDALYNQWANRAEPRMQQQAEQELTRLRNQGLKPGDEAYDRAAQMTQQNQSDARQQASFGATAGAGNEAQRMFGMDSGARAQQFGERGTQGSFANQAAGQAFGMGGQQYQQGLQNANYQTQQRQQQIAEEMNRRGFSLNEINAIISGQQVGMPSMPGFNTASKSSGVDYTGAAQNQYGAALDAANAKNAGIGNFFGGLTNLGSAFMMGG